MRRNPPLNQTANQLCWLVPSALRTPAAGSLSRWLEKNPPIAERGVLNGVFLLRRMGLCRLAIFEFTLKKD